MLYDCVRLVNRLWFRTDPRLREWWIILPRRIIQSICNLFNAVTKNVSTGARVTIRKPKLLTVCVDA